MNPTEKIETIYFLVKNDWCDKQIPRTTNYRNVILFLLNVNALVVFYHKKFNFAKFDQV